jgi:hypothetical protein
MTRHIAHFRFYLAPLFTNTPGCVLFAAAVSPVLYGLSISASGVFIINIPKDMPCFKDSRANWFGLCSPAPHIPQEVREYLMFLLDVSDVTRTFGCLRLHVVAHHLSPNITMCLHLTTGSVKYLLCGHVTNLARHLSPCLSSTCLASPNHSPQCGQGADPGCATCTQAQVACPRHHRCRVIRTVREQYDSILTGACPTCARK